VAGWFAEHLPRDGAYRAAFRMVVVAVLDHPADASTIRPFARRFGTPS
jgi:hypothetical protein